jgi:hypothetical protein
MVGTKTKLKVSDLTRYALLICGVTALTGCGGSQPPIGAPGAMPQTSAIATHTKRGKSWILHNASGGDLIYAVEGCGGTCVFSYPAGKLVGTLDKPEAGATSDCVDSDGNIFITADSAIYEYAHGGTIPVATLSVPGNQALGCSVDPRSGNLAVVFRGSGADVAVFPNATGNPTLYDSQIDSRYCGYDDQGNLFVDGYHNQSSTLAELVSGASSFKSYSLDYSIGNPGQVQWDGKYITWESATPAQPIISQLVISGSTATIISSVRLKNVKRWAQASWIFGDKVVAPYSKHGALTKWLAVWNYSTGKLTKQITDFGEYKKEHDLQAATLSVAP